jgi:hypothetical protein
MNHYTIEKEIPCWCVKAAGFPEGVLAAHQQLHAVFSFDEQRRFFGMSRPEGKDQIAYWAAVEIIDGDENKTQNMEKILIEAGQYYGTDITNFRKDIPAIGKTFQELVQHPQVAADGFCIEWYYNMNDVRCMVRLDNPPAP